MKRKQIHLVFFLILLTILSTSSLFFITPINADTTFTFGTTTVGTLIDSGDGNSITCNKYTAGSSGNLTNISVRVGSIDTANKGYSLAMYADNNNPTTILGYAVGTLTANTWNTLTVSAPIVSGNKYWLCYNTSTTNSSKNNMRYAGGSSPAIYKDYAYGSWPTTFGTVGGSWTSNYSLYATATIETVPTNTPTPTMTPFPTNTPIPTDTPTPTPTVAPTATPTNTPTPTTTQTNTPTPTQSEPTPTPTITQTTFTFGTTSVGGTTDSGDGSNITCNQYTASNAGTLNSLSVRVATIDAAHKEYSLALYADGNNTPTSLLGSANGILVADSWNTLSVSAPVTQGNNYWICYNTSTTNNTYNNMKYAAGAARALYKSQPYGTWTTTFGTPGGMWTDNYSLYATVSTGVNLTPTPTPTVAPTATITPTPTSAITPTITPTPTGTSSGMTLISRAIPAFASSGTPTSANDTDYNTTWRSSSATAWLAFNLSGIPSAQRNSVLLVWYNEATEAYDPALANESAIEYPKNYTIETNAAADGTSAPTSGWVTEATITNNKYHSRQHVIDLSGANWIRINVTSVNGGSRANLNMDLYDASNGLDDNWIIYGSSTPSMSMNHDVRGATTQSFSQMINQANPNVFPVQENGAISGLNTTDGVQYMDEWLSYFPGKYVGIALGANDADQCMNPTTFYNNFVIMINKVTTAGKVPVIPMINWSKLSTVQTCGPALIDKINQLYVDYPQVVHGPDLWTYFKNHPELIGSDNQHLTTEGQGIYRQLWAQMAIDTIYNQ